MCTRRIRWWRSSNCWCLSRFLYIWVNHIKEAFTYMFILWDWVSMLFFELTCFTHLGNLFCLKRRKSDDGSLRLHRSKPLEVDMVDSLLPQLDIHLNLETFGIHGQYTSSKSRMNLWPSPHPLVMSRPFFSIKQPPLLNRTCMPFSMIWPTETKFFIIVGTCKTFLMQVLLPSFSNEKLPTCRMGCVGLSSVST